MHPTFCETSYSSGEREQQLLLSPNKLNNGTNYVLKN
jgi:hypothetical protein